MKRFKKYLETQLKIIETQLEAIKKTITEFPSAKNIDIASYKNIDKIRKEYTKTYKVNIVKRIFGPSKKELQEFIHELELKRLVEAKESYQQKIKQITEYMNSSNENGLIKKMDTDKNLFILIFDYATNNSINPKELLEHIINICKYSLETEKLDSKIKNNIASFFDDNYQLIDQKEFKSIKLIIIKFFHLILGEDTETKYKMVLDQLYIELELLSKEQLPKTTKSNISTKRESLIELQKYINGLKVSKTLDIPTFTKLLNKAEIPVAHQEKLIVLMQKRIAIENERAEKEKIKSIIEHFLSQDEKSLLENALILERQIEGPLQAMLKRARKDVLSMCKYISMSGENINFHETTEILAERLRVLKSILTNVEHQKNPSNSLFYIISKEGLPLILRNIELYEFCDYNTIYNLLYRAATAETKKSFCINRINFYAISLNHIKLVYAETKGKRIIVEVCHNQSINTIKKHINNEIIKQIEEIALKANNTEFKKIHATYESVILECINIKGIEQPLTLKKVIE